MAGPFKPTHAPSPGMDLKMKGPGADAVNREAFQTRQAQVGRMGDSHVANHAPQASKSFGKEASQSFKQASNGDRGAGRGTLSQAFNSGKGR